MRPRPWCWTGNGVVWYPLNGVNPLMQKGEEQVLFLQWNPDTSSYVLVGGPQARFRVTNSIVYPLKSVFAKDYEGKAEQHLLDDIDVAQH